MPRVIGRHNEVGRLQHGRAQHGGDRDPVGNEDTGIGDRRERLVERKRPDEIGVGQQRKRSVDIPIQAQCEPPDPEVTELTAVERMVGAGDLIRAKIVGEGANLGVTQRGRVEYALKGGRINTDAIDNSAGVNSSDVEVNIKIALASAMRKGTLTRPARNKLLAEMTEEVGRLVLANNYQQTLALSVESRKGLAGLPHQARLMMSLEARGLLDRAVEALPSPAALADRAARSAPLTRAELGVLLAYAKIVLFSDSIAAIGLTPASPVVFIALYTLAGIFSAGWAGRLVPRLGARKVLQGGVALMLLGVGLCSTPWLTAIVAGLALFTLGFFAAHAVASGQVGVHAKGAKAQASALYLCAYYLSIVA